ncbi:glycosyltransferase family 39 protein [Candidatus Peregrinibacteria bacterium]|nr:glycosyltransferase family 39 protein [Candidatus Peregrinibacteria bacterium]
MNKGIIFTVLIGIVFVGTFLRLNHINDNSLWLDEGITYYNSSGKNYSEVWDKTRRLDQSPPAYYFIMHTYLDLFGENEFGFRLIPLIFGVLSILFLYFLISEMFSREAGLIAAGLLAINPFHIGFSIESRMYVLLSLEGLIAFYLTYKAVSHEKNNYVYWLLFSLVSILGLYTHNFYLFILAGTAFSFFFLLIGAKKKLEKFLSGIVSLFLIFLGYLPWFFNLLYQLKVERYWLAENSISDLKSYFLDFVNQNNYVFIGFLVLSCIAFIWALIRRKPATHKKNLLNIVAMSVFIIFGIGLPLGYSLFFSPILKIRYAVYLLPFWLGIISVGIYSFKRMTWLIPILIFGLFIYLLKPWQMPKYPTEIGENYRGLVDIVLKKQAPIIVHSPSITHVINFYNKGRISVKPFPNTDDLRTFDVSRSLESEFKSSVKGLKSFYLAITHSHEKPMGLLVNWSNELCDQSVKIDVKGINLYYFDECKSIITSASSLIFSE